MVCIKIVSFFYCYEKNKQLTLLNYYKSLKLNYCFNGVIKHHFTVVKEDVNLKKKNTISKVIPVFITLQMVNIELVMRETLNWVIWLLKNILRIETINYQSHLWIH